MPDAAMVRADRDGAWKVLRWAGDIDMANVSIVERQTLDAIANEDEGAVIDVADVTYIDSAGMRALVTISQLMAERQQRLFLVVPTGSLHVTALRVGGVTTVIPTFDSEQAAREARSN